MGLGNDDPDQNPFVAAQTPFLETLLGGKLTASLNAKHEGRCVLKHLDANLGHAGLPQSATGQTALLTGKNGADIMQGHYGPWPGPTLKKVVDEHSLFSEVIAVGGSAALANAYPPGYFRAVERGKQKVNVPVYAALQAGVRQRDLDDYKVGNALSLDLTGAYVQRLEPSQHLITPQESGRRLSHLAQQHSFTFFDFWPTDHAGHRSSFMDCIGLIETLDAFLSEALEPSDDLTCLLTSDHGNLEDKTTKGHTRNAVPLIVCGAQAEAFAEAESILDIAPKVRGVLGLRQR